MSERPVRPTPEMVAAQERAADPQSTVWVSANAGAGKTHVLTNRVLRLLLTGVRPEEILCLTYTKAAAAEMRARVSARLGKWAIDGEQDVANALKQLAGIEPNDALIRRARTLFAHALDTPGGLKINTIHAFCESVLHRFPLEAGVPFGFTVIEDAERERLVRQAREKVFADALAGKDGLREAVDTLFEQFSDQAMEQAIASALGDMRKLMPVLADVDGAKARLRKLIKAEQIADLDVLHRAMTAETLLTREHILLVRNELEPKPDGKRPVDRIAAIETPDAPNAAELTGIFFTNDGAPRKSLLNKKPSEDYPELLDALQREQARLMALDDQIARAETVLRSEALVDVLHAVLAEYELQKRARARLDFDDLVNRTAALFGDQAQGAWVRYKLDAGITHILVDESQDTNPEQWKVVDALADEFFAGDSAAQRPRSLFSVGDPKQSIFSFQGADPSLFGESGIRYRRKAGKAGRTFDAVPMKASFRTLSHVLDAVDKVFADPSLAQSVLNDGPVEHISARTHHGGSVALWPLVTPESGEDADDPWHMADSSASLKSPAQRHAQTIASTIADWVRSGRLLTQRDPPRPIAPGDVLILVQSRNALFHEIIRALKKSGLATPGADRIDVGNHIATRDLLALGDVLLNTEDDLSLAALLRSPLFDVTEDDLFDLAHERAGTLWQALSESKSPHAADAFERLSRWRSRLDFERPYEFYADMLYAEGGLRRFHARLGGEVDDIVGEFLALALAYEQAELPSLQGFVADMRARKVDIKRELGDSESGVRVMTIHGAKGLEAPVVILADAGAKPQGSQTRRDIYFDAFAGGPVLVHAGRESQRVEETEALVDKDKQRQIDEYWRKLYVGMTRAEDELHVTGILSKKGGIDGTWYGAVDMALADDTVERVLAQDLTVRLFPKSAEPDRFSVEGAARLPAETPETLGPVALRIRPEMLTPSTLDHAADPFDSRTEAIIDADLARRRGIALHALLQHLPSVPDDKRKAVALGALETLLPEAPTHHEELAGTALALLHAPELGAAFGPQSRAEVPIMARAMRNGKEVLIAGRIDRMIVTDTDVTIVDFKSDANPPADQSGIPNGYVAQLGLYALVLKRIFPDRRITASLLWTSNAQLMPIDPKRLEHASAGIVL